MTTPKAHGLLFTAPMIRAFLRAENLKTQTRRIPTAANSLVDGDGMSAKRWAAMNFDFTRAFVDKGSSPAGNPGPYIQVPARNIELNGSEETWHRVYPRVQPGDLIWARENFQPLLADDTEEINAANYKTGKGYTVSYPATDGIVEYYDCTTDNAFCDRVTPSIHMPMWASRIKRNVTSVRAERLHAISEQDAQAEGAMFHDGREVGHSGWRYDFQSPVSDTCSQAYFYLWQQINGQASLAANPITWVYDLQPVSVA